MPPNIVQIVTQEQPSFDDFWAAYPKKYGPGNARSWWMWSLGKTTPAEMVAGAKRYAQHVAATGLEWQYVLKPGKWLEEEHWADEYQLPKVKQVSPQDSRLMFMAAQVRRAATNAAAETWVRNNVTPQDREELRQRGLIT